MREVYTRREVIVAALVGLSLFILIWGPVLLRPLGYSPAVDLRTLQSTRPTRPVHAHPSSSSPARVAKTRPSRPVDLNRADVPTLQTLPGIGPTLAARIVSHRQAHGPFQEAQGLMEVEGIGPKRFETLKSWIEAR